MVAKRILLELDGIGFGYPGYAEVLSGITASLYEGEIVCVIGSSGCGKSTLLNIAGGFLFPDSGTVRFSGCDNPPPGIKRIMVFQDGNQLFPWLTAAGNVMFPMTAAGLKRSAGQELRKSAVGLLDKVGLKDAADLYPVQLSGGMKQRAVIARALASRPELLLLDEPFTALDAPTRRGLQDMLLTLNRDLKISMMFVTHDIREAVYIADRILIMNGTGLAEIRPELERGPGARDEFSDEFVRIEREVFSLI